MSNENKTALTAEEFIKDYDKQYGSHWTDSNEDLANGLNHFASLQTKEKDKEIDKWSDRWAETNNQLDEVKKERDVYKDNYFKALNSLVTLTKE